MTTRDAPPKPQLVLFDMDRTLLRGNSGSMFMEFRRRRGEVSRLHMLRVGFWLLRYSMGMLDASKVSKMALSEYAGTEESALRLLCEQWILEEVVPQISPRARETVEEHQQCGDVVAIATSSTVYGTLPLAQALGIEHVICSELEVQNGKFTGEVTLPICYGVGKRDRAERFAKSRGFSLAEATFYSDSITDLPLLEAVRRPVAVNPDTRLRRVARQRGWKTVLWM